MKNRRYFSASIVAIIALVIVGGGLFAINVVGQSPGPTSKPIPPSPDPDQNRTTSERATAYTQGFQQHLARRAQFIQGFSATRQTLSSLPRIRKAASYVPAQRTLSDALRNAEVIVDGTITGIRFTPTETIATVQIGVPQKVSPAALARLGTARPTQIEVNLGYSVEPDPTYTMGRLVIPENEPLLLPGDRAKLFLRIEPARGRFAIQSWTGGYSIDSAGRVVPLLGNPFADQVKVLTLPQFTTLVTNELSRIQP